MKTTSYLFTFLILFTSCKKSNNDGPANVDNKVTVYISGYNLEKNGLGYTPCYWKDSSKHIISEWTETGRAYAINYANEHLFVAGFTNVVNAAPSLWVDGVLKIFNYTHKYQLDVAYGMCVSGTDLYLVGRGPDEDGYYVDGHHHAMIWKNEELTFINNEYDNSVAIGVATIGTDVYVAWHQTGSDGSSRAKYNKNGQTFNLDSSDVSSNTSAICVSGPDVYIAGNLYDTITNHLEGVYWKNGVLTKISDKNYGTSTTGIAVSGQDVYISGIVYAPASTYAAYWKNGVEQKLSGISTNDSRATGIAVSGRDVYVCGVDGNVPKYWKNGTVHELSYNPSDTLYEVTGITVVPK